MTEPEQQPEIPFMSRLDGVAIELHEMFTALKGAGFRHKDALYIISIAVSEGVMLPVYSHTPDNLDNDEDGFDDEDFGDNEPPFNVG
jgi:hypothetical protein